MSTSPASVPTTVSVAVGPMLGPVLRRVVGMLAARADLPLDRLDDAVLVADLIAEHVGTHAATGVVDVELSSGERDLSVRLGPLKQGHAMQLVADAQIPGVGNVIEQLTDQVTVLSGAAGDDEHLLIRLAYLSS